MPAFADLKLICSCAPASELTFVADSVVTPVEKPVPLTVTVVDPVKPVPLTTTVLVVVLLAVHVPKSIVEPLAGEENTADEVDDDEPLDDDDDDAAVALRLTLIVVLPLVSVNVPVYEPAVADLKFT